MKTRLLVALLVAATLPVAAARGAGFEGLRPEGSNPIKGQSGEIERIDPNARSFRIGGNDYTTPADVIVDFETFKVGDEVVVYYHDRGTRLVVQKLEHARKRN